MFKFSKRVFVAMMATVIIASTILPGISFAENTEETQVIKDNSEERVAQTVSDGVVTKATFDKDKNILTIEENGTIVTILDLGQLSEQYLEEEAISIAPKASSNFGIMAVTTKQDTFINYEYTITSGSLEKWQLRRPKGDSLVNYYYKNTTRTSSNASNLDNFQTAVENINYYEWIAIGSSLTSLGMSWLTFILSVPTAGAATLTTGLAALGAYGTALNALLKIHENANRALSLYGRV